jgi:hypothetical protein
MFPRATAVLLATAVTAPSLQAQFWESLLNPEVKVTLTHPPSLGLKVQRVAFAPVREYRAQDLVAACIADLSAAGGIELLDRGNIERVLNKQKLSNSGLFDESTAVAMGRLLGSGVLLFVQVQRLDLKHIPLVTKGVPVDGKEPRTWIAKTQAEYNASVQAVDLATGRIYTQMRIAVSPSRENRSDQGLPEYPSDTEVSELAVRMATERVHQMLLPWTEERKLIFYNDKDYGMKEAFKRLQLNDPQGALQRSLEALEAARAANAKTKYIARTNYNVGMCRFILGDYPGALPYLRAAREIDARHRIFADAETECLRAKGLSEEMSKVDARSAKVELDVPRPAQPALPMAPEPVPAPAAAAPPKGATPEERLERLENLRKKGLINAKDYAAKKAEIMKEL